MSLCFPEPCDLKMVCDRVCGRDRGGRCGGEKGKRGDVDTRVGRRKNHWLCVINGGGAGIEDVIWSRIVFATMLCICILVYVCVLWCVLSSFTQVCYHSESASARERKGIQTHAKSKQESTEAHLRSKKIRVQTLLQAGF